MDPCHIFHKESKHFTSTYDVGYSIILLSTLSAFTCRGISGVVEFGLDVSHGKHLVLGSHN